MHPDVMRRYEEGRRWLREGRKGDARDLASALRRQGRADGKRDEMALGMLLAADLAADAKRHGRAVRWARLAMCISPLARGAGHATMARALLNSGRFTEAIRHAARGYAALKRRGLIEDAAASLFNVAAGLANLGEEDKAEIYRARAAEFASRNRVRVVLGYVHASRGIEAGNHGKLEEEKRHLEQALDCLSGVSGNNLRIRTLAMLGRLCARQGDRKRAFSLIDKARAAIRARPGSEMAYEVERQYALILMDLEEYDRAHAILEHLIREAASPHEKAVMSFLFVRLLIEMGKTEDALRHFEEARAEAEREGFPDERAGVEITAAWLKLISGRIHEASYLADILLERYRGHGNRYLEMEANLLMGHVFFRRGDVAGAIGQMQAALQLAAEMGVKPETVRIHVHLAGLHHILGDRPAAQAHLLEACRHMDGLDLPVTGYVLAQCLRRFSLSAPAGDSRPVSASLGRIQRERAVAMVECYGFREHRRFQVMSHGTLQMMEGEVLERFLWQCSGVALDQDEDRFLLLRPSHRPRPLAALFPGSVSARLLQCLMLAFPRSVTEARLWKAAWKDPYRTLRQIQCLRSNLSRLREILRREGLPDLIQRTDEGYRLAPSVAWIVTRAEAAPDPEPDRRNWICRYLREHGSIANADICRHRKVSSQTAYNDLQMLLRQGLIQPMGKGRATRYVLIHPKS